MPITRFFFAYSAGEQSENLNFFTSYFMRVASIQLCHFAAFCQITCCAYSWTKYGFEFSHCLENCTWLNTVGGPGQLSRYSDSLRTGRSGDRMPVGGEIFRTCPHRPWDQPDLLYNGYRVFPGCKAAGTWRRSSTASSAVVKEKVEL